MPLQAMTNRRQFFCHCSALAAAASLVPVVALGTPFDPADVPVDQLSLAAFAAQLRSRFLARGPSQAAVSLQLIEARPLISPRPAAPDAPDALHEKFALLFQGSLHQPLPQDTFRFEHPQLGRFEMFIVPVGATDPDHRYYEAIFNRQAGVLS